MENVIQEVQSATKTIMIGVLCSFLAIWATVLIAATPRTVECGACGANVYESWSVPTMDGSGFASVCGKCYDVAVENN